MDFVHKIAAGVSEGILHVKNQFGGQVNLINFYKSRLPYWIRHFKFKSEYPQKLLSNNFQVKLINLYKPRSPYRIRPFEFLQI